MMRRMLHKQQKSENKPRVLVVDDEKKLAELISMALGYEGYETTQASTGYEAMDAVRDWRPDVVILDVMIPGPDGFEVLKRMRDSKINTPVMFLTARSEVPDRVRGLRGGGDDYMTKPFSIDELVARTSALLRRSDIGQKSEDKLVVGDLVMNDPAREVFRGEEKLSLTATEYELLHYLMSNATVVVSKTQILDNVWNYDFGGHANNVEIYISYLRKKVDKGRTPMIHTVRGFGYVLKPAT